MENQVEKKAKFSVVKALRALVIIALIAGVAGLGYLYYTTRQELKFLASPAGQDELAKKEVQQVVDALSKLAILPQEDPVVATITDHAALASQSAFYANSVNGDKLVVYTQAQQAFIYSPERNKIVNVGPLLIEDAPVGENADGTTEEVSSQSLSLEVRNGSTTAGKANNMSTEITSALQNVTISGVAQAANTEYEGNTIVDLSGGSLGTAAQQLASRFNAKVVTTLPQGETATEADLLMIVGN